MSVPALLKSIPSSFLWLVGLLSMAYLLLGLANNLPVLVAGAILLTLGLEGSKIVLAIWGGKFGKIIAGLFAVLTVFAIANASYTSIETLRSSGSSVRLAALQSSTEYLALKNERDTASANREHNDKNDTGRFFAKLNLFTTSISGFVKC